MKYHLSKTDETVSFTQIIGTNSKLRKEVTGLKYTATILGLMLAPSIQSGYNVCPTSTPACRESCVTWFAGRRVMDEVREAAIARTKLWLLDRTVFTQTVENELRYLTRRSKRTHGFDSVLFRPNVSSDIPWEKFGLVDRWLTVVDGMYDYTANFKRMIDSLQWSRKYWLTFSVKEDTSEATVREVLGNGGNVAIVVDVPYKSSPKAFGILPEYVTIGRSKQKYKVIDGDIHDMRTPETDGRGNVVLLRLKGTIAARAIAREYNFAKRLPLIGSDTKPSIALGEVSKLCL